MLAAADVHLGPVFGVSRAFDHWILAHCPESLYSGFFWNLCLAPLVLVVLAVGLGPAAAPNRWQRRLFLALVLGTLLVARLPMLCYDAFNPDEAFLLASAMRVPIDPVAYRSFDVMTSGPLNVYARSVPAWFGLPLNYVSSRLTGTLLVFGTLEFLWLVYRRYLGERAACLALMPPFCFHIFAGDSDFTHYSSEHVAIFLAAATLCLLAAEHRAGSQTGSRRLALAGLLAGSMMFAKLQAIPLEAALLAISMALAWRKPRRIPALASVAASAAVVPAAFLTMFLWCGVLPHFWITYFRKNAAYAGDAALSVYARILSAWNLLFHLSNLGDYELALMVVWGIGLAAAVWAALRYRRMARATRGPLRQAAELALASWLLLGAAFIAVATPGREFMHYLLFLIVPSGLVTASSFLWIRLWLQAGGRRNLGRWAAAGFVLLTCAAPTVLREHIDDVWDADYFLPAAPLPSAIRSYATSRDTIVVWGWRSGLYILSSRAPGTRFADAPLQIEASTYQQYYRDIYLADFLRSRPAVFVDAVGPTDFQYIDRAVAGYETFTGLRQVIARDYLPAGEIDGARLFVRRDRLLTGDR